MDNDRLLLLLEERLAFHITLLMPRWGCENALDMSEEM